MKLFTRLFLLVLSLAFSTLSVEGQVVANFTASPTSGCPPLLVTFTNTSTGATSYRWDLDNGDHPFTLTDVTSSYPVSGTFTATLTAFNGTDSSKHTINITVYPNPIANFSASDTAVCPGTPITFTSTTIGGVSGPVTCNWNFGDGSGLPGNPVTHTYNTPGYYNVTLTAVNSEGCGDDTTKLAYIHVYTPPTPSFSSVATYYCNAPATVNFTSSVSGFGPFTYDWTFGDFTASSFVADPTHTYLSTGTYTVELKVTDGHGCEDSVTVPAYIVVTHVVASFTYPDTACVNSTVSFVNTSSAHTASNWTYGDGHTGITDAGSNIYTTPGLYTVTLIVFDGPCSDTISHQIYIRPGPTASFTQNPIHPCPPPVDITFTATVPGTASVTWLFGDGTSGAGTTITHLYENRGIDTIRMIVHDSRTGCIDTIIKIDTLYDLNWALVDTPSSGCAPLSVFFDTLGPYTHEPPDTLITKFYPWPFTTFTWGFGDGSSTSTLSDPTHTYTAAGVYNAYLTAVTANGCTETDTVQIKVGQPPVVTFTAAPTHVCYGRPVTYTITVISGPVSVFYWQFGDGGEDSTHSTVYTYIDTIPGVFTVTLTAFYNGCPSVPVIMHNYITVDSPKSIPVVAVLCSPPATAQFGDSSLGDDTHTWIFGDGTTSTLANPLHTFPSLTTYSVELVTYNAASGCHDTATLSVDLSRPAPHFSMPDSNICKYDTGVFTPTVTGGTASTYEWLIDGTEYSLFPVFKYGFNVSGIYTVTLIIKDQNGCLDTVTRNNYVHVGKPVPNFTASPTSGCWPLTVTFTDHSTDIAGATPFTDYAWAFGDGATSTVTTASVVHTYTMAGAYTTQEIVTDNIGCVDTVSLPLVTVFRPTASFTASTTFPCPGAPVAFTNTSGTITSSLWIFGDGTTSALTDPTHTYGAPGVYTVQLVVTDSHGCTDTATYLSYINVTKPHASFYMTDSFSICPPLTVNFVNTSTGATNYLWNLGDGSSSVLTDPSDFYISIGSYTVTLIASNIHGCTDTAIGHAAIYGYVGGFSYNPDTGCTPLTVHFYAATQNVPNIVWDFSDGTTSSVSYTDTISHTYTIPGAYVPRLILSDNTGCKNSSIGIDTIKVDAVIAGFTTVPNPICQAGQVTFDDTSRGYWDPANSWFWTLSDGTTTTVENPSTTYSATGTYPVTLTVTDTWGCIATITRDVMVYPPAVITVSPDTTICIGDKGTLTGYGGVSYTWEPRSSVSCSPCNPTLASPTVVTTYTVSGTDVHGCVNTDTVTVSLKSKTISVATGDTQICVGQVVPLFDSGANKFTWIPATGLSSAIIANPLASPQVTTTYEVIAQLGSCVPDTNFVTVIVHPLPTVNAGPDQDLLAGSQAQLQATGTLIKSYLWSDPGTLSCDSCANPVASMSVTTTYFVDVSSAFGCRNSDSVTIRLYCDQGQLFIPNAFTPNGDGKDDVFYPRGKGISTIKSFRIYNRWGELLFERSGININDANNAWDGSYKGDAPRPDVYVWIIDAVCETGQPINLKGDVTIIR